MPPHRDFSRAVPRATLLAKRYIVAIGGLAYGLTLGMRRGRHRALIAHIASHFGFRGGSAGRLTRVSIDDVTNSATSIVIPVAAAHPGNVSALELIVIARLIAEMRPRDVLEIGTFDGRTTAALAANAPNGATVVTLDLPPETGTSLPVDARDEGFIQKPRSGAAFAGSVYETRIRQVFGDSATYDFGTLRVDFAFIDGSHSYEYTLSDSRRVLGLMRDGRGVIVWHDYGGEWEGVTRALDELSAKPAFQGLASIDGTTLAILDRR